MDTRIGYPNEHIAKSIVDEIKSPMYATSVGLVIKGLNDSITDREEPPTQEEIVESIKHPKTGGFLKNWLDKGMAWLNDADDMKDF
jgi:cell division protein FtsA